MLCPVCDVKLITVDKKNDGTLVRRRFECDSCFTTFHSTEKINYEKLPRYILDKIHEKVEMRR